MKIRCRYCGRSTDVRQKNEYACKPCMVHKRMLQSRAKFFVRVGRMKRDETEAYVENEMKTYAKTARKTPKEDPRNGECLFCGRTARLANGFCLECRTEGFDYVYAVRGPRKKHDRQRVSVKDGWRGTPVAGGKSFTSRMDNT